MNSQLSMKLTHDKFRFHISTIEVDNNTVQIGGNNYRVKLSVNYLSCIDVEKANTCLTNLTLHICESLHHKTVIPSENSNILITKTENQVSVDHVSGDVHFSFPLSCVFVCSVGNTRIEDLCEYVGGQLVGRIKEKSSLEQAIEKVKIKVSQNIGPRVATRKFLVN